MVEKAMTGSLGKVWVFDFIDRFFEEAYSLLLMFFLLGG
jgi:hypothetical protein